MEGSTKGTVPRIFNRNLFEAWLLASTDGKESTVSAKIKTLLDLTDINEDQENFLDETSKYFCMNAKRMWKNCDRRRTLFEKRHEQWLNSTITVDPVLKIKVDMGEQLGPSRGRPRKSFKEASLKTKKRRIQELATKSPAELQFAAERFRSVSYFSETTTTVKTLTPQQALALYFELDLSVRKYNVLRSVVNNLHKGCFPSYHVLTATKSLYLPCNITCTETSAEVELQQLLEKTVGSILKISHNILDENASLKLICKWGFDGSSGHSLYKQKFEDSTYSDEFLFFIALVPIKLIDESNQKTIWLNTRTSSTLFCRPIFIFSKEVAELVRGEEEKMTTKISKLSVYSTSYFGKNLTISFQMLFTMFDGSVANILSETNASSKCFICGASPKEMNTIEVTHKPPNTKNYRFGLSSLHCWIRFFECLLHIAYRLPLKTWQVRGVERKQIFANRKAQIKSDFRSKMGLTVDKPKPGYGSTNDGNTARRFFGNPDLSAEITGINKTLITNFSLILRIIACGHNINLSKFSGLLNNTKQLYLNLYRWFYMPSSVHKVLVHGCDIIDFFDLPIGQLSEEALEARHKEIRKIRLCHTRKSSRTNKNMDIMQTLVLTSDPELSSHRKTHKKSTDLDPEIQEYVINDQSDDQAVLPFTDLNIDSCSEDESD